MVSKMSVGLCKFMGFKAFLYSYRMCIYFAVRAKHEYEQSKINTKCK